MIRKCKKFMQRYMLRPVIYMTSTRFLLALALVMLWDRISGTRSAVDVKSFGFLFASAFFFLLMWISYLRMDGLHMPKLFMKRVNIRKKPTRSYGDMIDYVDEEPISFDDLEDDEKDFCCLASDLICCIAFVLLSFL